MTAFGVIGLHASGRLRKWRSRLSVLGQLRRTFLCGYDVMRGIPGGAVGRWETEQMGKLAEMRMAGKLADQVQWPGRDEPRVCSSER